MKRTVKLGDDNAMKWVCSSYDAADPPIQTKETMDGFESFYKLVRFFRLSFTNEKMPTEWSSRRDNDPNRSSKLRRFLRNTMSIQLNGRVNLLLTRAQSNVSAITLDRQADLFETKGS